jgi:uncharacterized protein (TIGR02246 family)
MSAAELAIANRRFEEAVAKRDINAIANLYTADAVLLPTDGQIIKGREAIKRQLEPLVENGLKSATSKSIKVEVNGDIATDIGYVSFHFQPPGGAIILTDLTYLVVWKKVDGQWLIHRDMVSTRSHA